jgi:hypothetical protein
MNNTIEFIHVIHQHHLDILNLFHIGIHSRSNNSLFINARDLYHIILNEEEHPIR